MTILSRRAPLRAVSARSSRDLISCSCRQRSAACPLSLHRKTEFSVRILRFAVKSATTLSDFASSLYPAFTAVSNKIVRSVSTQSDGFRAFSSKHLPFPYKPPDIVTKNSFFATDCGSRFGRTGTSERSSAGPLHVVRRLHAARLPHAAKVARAALKRQRLGASLANASGPNIPFSAESSMPPAALKPSPPRSRRPSRRT